MKFAYLTDKNELKSIVEQSVEETVQKILPDIIRKASRKKWLTTDEVMEMLQVSRRQIQNYRDENLLAFTQNGRTIRYDIDDVEEFLNKHKVRRINRFGGKEKK